MFEMIKDEWSFWKLLWKHYSFRQMCQYVFTGCITGSYVDDTEIKKEDKDGNHKV